MVPQNNDLAAKLKAAKERLEAKNRKDTQSVALSANPANPLSKYYQPEQAATTPKPTQTEQVKSIPGPFVSQPSFQPSASPICSNYAYTFDRPNMSIRLDHWFH